MKHVRIISFLLCLVLLAGLLPATVRADDPDWALLVDGRPVRENNAGDILGNGIFSYFEREEKAREGYEVNKYLLIRGDYTAKNGGPLIENRSIAGLRIKVDCACTLTASGTVISAAADTTLMGFAGLTLKSETGACIEVRNGKKLTLHGVNLKADAKTVALSGSETGEELFFASSVAELHGEQQAIRGFNGSMVLHETSFVKQPENTYVANNEFHTQKTLIQVPLIDPVVNPTDVLISTYADRNDDDAVTVDDLLQFIVYVSNNTRILMALTMAYLGYPFETFEEYDFDLNGQNGRQDFQFFIDRLFPDGAVEKVILSAYNASTGQYLDSFMFKNITDLSLDAFGTFLMKKNEFRMFIIGENAVPLCQSTMIDRTNAE